MGESPALVAGLDDVAVMGKTIEQGRGHLRIAEHGGPLPKGEVRRDLNSAEPGPWSESAWVMEVRWVVQQTDLSRAPGVRRGPGRGGARRADCPRAETLSRNHGVAAHVFRALGATLADRPAAPDRKARALLAGLRHAVADAAPVEDPGRVVGAVAELVARATTGLGT